MLGISISGISGIDMPDIVEKYQNMALGWLFPVEDDPLFGRNIRSSWWKIMIPTEAHI